jgi:hypothetical protein
VNKEVQGSGGQRLALTATKSISQLKMEKGLEALRMDGLTDGLDVSGQKKARLKAEVDAKKGAEDMSQMGEAALTAAEDAAQYAAEDVMSVQHENIIPGWKVGVTITTKQGASPQFEGQDDESGTGDLMPQRALLFPSGLVHEREGTFEDVSPHREGTFEDVSHSVAGLIASNRTLKHIKLCWPLPEHTAVGGTKLVVGANRQVS